MAFSWRRIRRHLASRAPHPHDPRADADALGHFAEAPSFRAAPAEFRVCPHGWNTLHGAAALGYARIVRRMLGQGTAVNGRDAWGRTALVWAVEDGRRAVVELLLARGADPDVADEAGVGALHAAARRGERELAVLLLDAGADPDGGAGAATTPLAEAVRRGDAALAELLLARGASPDAPDRYGQTPLFHVSAAAADRMLPLLLDAGAALGARAADGDTARHRALRRGDAALWKALTPAEDEVEAVRARGRADDTLLMAAAEGGNPNLLKRLIAQGADPEARNRHGHGALLVALTAENLPAAAVLTGAGAQIGFLEAVAMGDAERAASASLPAGTVLDAPIAGLETPLMGAVARGRADLAILLLDAGASPDAGTAVIGTPLDVAALTGQDDLVRLLIQRGADPSRAVRVSPAELRRRAQALADPPPSLPPLGAARPDTEAVYAAAVAGDDRALAFLRLCGGEVDVRDDEGRTALIRAADDGDAPAVRRLLAFGADPNLRGHDGRRAVERARDRGRDAVVQVLEG